MASVALLAGTTFLSPSPVHAQDDDSALEVEDLRVGDDEHQRYFLMKRTGAEAPKKGFKLMLVLPGGSGSADFRPFVGRIHEHALDEDYLIAQLVAPVWTDEQAKKLVWPVEKNPHEEMQFSTEAFMHAVIADVEARHDVDPDYVFALGWSSSGPAVYAYSVQDGSRLTGAFVAMSVFKPEHMESTKGAKGKAYFLLHSPDDFIKMDFPEAAEKKLEKSKAKVKLLTYPGGHGWKGDVWGNIGIGVRFLEKNHGKPPKRRK